jgi:hypothetical protein
MKFWVLGVLVLGATVGGYSQTKSAVTAAKKPAPAVKKPGPATVAKPAGPAAASKSAAFSSDKGKAEGRTYTNKELGFEVTFPDTWLIPDPDFEAYMLKQGFDLRLKAPEGLPVQARARMNQALKRVNVLVTAYRSMSGSDDNAIMRISVEDLSATPQVKDAVDYFDLMRAQFATMKLPADFKYSETQAEALGRKQFGFIDTSSRAGKKRMYATVRGRQAILFTLSYSDDADLETMRRILSEGNFNVR